MEVLVLCTNVKMFLPRINVIQNDFVCVQVKLVGNLIGLKHVFGFLCSIISTTLNTTTRTTAVIMVNLSKTCVVHHFMGKKFPMLKFSFILRTSLSSSKDSFRQSSISLTINFQLNKGKHLAVLCAAHTEWVSARWRMKRTQNA